MTSIARVEHAASASIRPITMGPSLLIVAGQATTERDAVQRRSRAARHPASPNPDQCPEFELAEFELAAPVPFGC